LRIGYGAHLENYNPSLRLTIGLEKLSRVPFSPFEEAQIAARKICGMFASPPTICLSGGVDSEAVALAFLAAGVSFDATTLRFNNGLNEHEIARAREFCQTNGVKQNFIDLDVVDFFETKKFLLYQDKYFCYALEIAVQLWFIEQIKRPFVWGGEPFRLFMMDGEPQIQAVSGYDAVISRYVEKNNLTAVPNFHFFTPELAWAFFRESLRLKSTVHSKNENYADKIIFYGHCGFSGLNNPARTQKMHGFEMVKQYFDERLTPLSYNEVYRSPAARKYPAAESSVVKFPKDDLIAKQIMGLI
jgi:asparagine synthetase B (glutamine-hydrolysing)